MQFFQDLGALVEQRWRDRSYDEDVFPKIAAEALAERPPVAHVDPWDIIRWLNTTTQLPEQRDVEGRFGNPPITLYNGPRFYIDVYFWLDGTTSIHQHAFCGAFQVLLGSSILSQYDFQEEQRINAHFSIGQMRLREVELLTEGDIREIPPGKQYIHSLFHLERPSATAIIRTHQSQIGLPQYSYHKPYFAVDPFFRDAAMTKRVQSAALLLHMRHPKADDLIGEVLSSSDFQTAFSILDLAFNTLSHDALERGFGVSTGKERFEALLQIARRRHGEQVDRVRPVFEEVQRQQNLIQRRGQITSYEHRLFIALLLNVPDREKILDLVQNRFPAQSAIATLTDWLEELANTRVAGSTEPNVLGIDNYGEDYLFVFQSLLEGLTLDQMRTAFEKEFAAEYTQTVGNKLEELHTAIRNSMLFKSIFSDSPSSTAVTTQTTIA